MGGVTNTGGSETKTYTPTELALLERYFSPSTPREHGDIYLVRNLPQEVAATLNGVYSRSSLSMRDNFLERLKKGLAATGKDLDSIEVPPTQADLLTSVMADKAGQFLKTYAIDHGHNSLREGSFVHLAVENVSQLVTRYIQRERRCSFEESSTRYISFSREKLWQDPDVMAAGGEVAKAYQETLDETFGFYQEATEILLDHLKAQRPLGEGEKQGPWLRALRAEAFDAARYLLTPAVLTKWGMLIDARTLADMVSDLLSHPLREFREVGQRLLNVSEEALPTLLSHAAPNTFQQDQHQHLRALAAELVPAAEPSQREPGTELLAHDPDLDDRLLASLLYDHHNRPFGELLDAVKAKTTEEKAALMDRIMAQRGKHDPLPMATEGALPFEFEVTVDFGAYRDIGRHRKGYQQQQPLTMDHGYVVPPLMDEVGLGDRYREVMDRAAARQRVVAAAFPEAAGYVTPFASLQRIRIVFDPRQTAYFIELRSGPEGHFAYRKVALDMQAAVERVSPLFARFIRAQKGDAFLGRMVAEQTADERRKKRMQRAGDA